MPTKQRNDATLMAARGCINFQFRKTARALSQFYDEGLRPTGLRSTQFTMLVVIETSQPVSMSELANLLMMDRSTLTRNFHLLEQQELVSTRVGTDRRSRLVRLTRKGGSALTRALPYWQKAQQQVLDRIGGKELQALVDGIRSLGRLNGG
jgi:DNA-binding MarR family transcriptional regulator